MNSGAWLLLVAFLVSFLLLAHPLARAIDAIVAGKISGLRRVESLIFKLAGVDETRESGWVRYALGLLLFNGLGVLAVYLLLRLQNFLPFNPEGFPAVSADSAFERASKFNAQQAAPTMRWGGYLGATLVCAVTALLSTPLADVLEITNIVMLFLLAPARRASGANWRGAIAGKRVHKQQKQHCLDEPRAASAA